MVNHDLVVSAKTAKGLVSLLEEIAVYEENLRVLRQKILMALPEPFFKYGSKLWWERAEYQADEDIREGRISKAYDNADELIRDLKQGVLAKS